MEDFEAVTPESIEQQEQNTGASTSKIPRNIPFAEISIKEKRHSQLSGETRSIRYIRAELLRTEIAQTHEVLESICQESGDQA